MEDLLSEALKDLRLRSARYLRFEFHAPWAVRYAPSGRGVHIVVRGRCELAVSGVPPELLQAGDIVIVPGGAEHVLRVPGQRGRPIDVDDLVAQSPPGAVLHGGSGEECVIVCGKFLFDEGVMHPALRSLPAVIHVPGEVGAASPPLRSLVEMMVAEATARKLGSDVIIARLSDALVTIALRHWVERSQSRSGWLQALGDPQLALALARIHGEPAHPWTVESLARHSGMSRSLFAERFKRVLGEAPLRYLTRYRMYQAQGLLQASDLSIAQVAEQVGYSSEAAFSTAFRQWLNEPPARYRRRVRSGDSAQAPLTI